MKSIIFILSLITAVNAWATEKGRVYLVTPSEQVKLGSEFYVDIQGDNLPALYGVDLKLEFDANKFEFIDQNPNKEGVQIEHGNFFDNDSIFVLHNSAETVTGTAAYVVSQVAPANEVKGSGRIAGVKLKSINRTGLAHITIASAQFGTKSGQLKEFALGPALLFDFKPEYQVPEQPQQDTHYTTAILLFCLLLFAIIFIWFIRRDKNKP
ncbi:cohesin domain-containing protein [Pseudoalteromonas byunsanensis]|uniref:Cohesin domain-containing protein n=1 Tax=Pseudoalteromonas byunsanensis TaxID=327939 RepID=A0A1S1NAS2_9GAMM|nr:cohesin domain-containing protein [Pseudoalteromonas byunsanensis]OHU96495.1 hypothetical protein BIW53_03985 [Pseudoalteromonas byunsanensis]